MQATKRSTDIRLRLAAAALASLPPAVAHSIVDNLAPDVQNWSGEVLRSAFEYRRNKYRSPDTASRSGDRG